MSTPAKLPPELVRGKPKLIGALAEGERVSADFTSLRVNEARECFLDARGKVLPISHPNFCVIEVYRCRLSRPARAR